MSKRVSYSVLDPWLTLPLKRFYPWLPIPKSFPPEGIVLAGHLLAIGGALGFAYATKVWWGGALVAMGVAGNHLADCLDGTHARATGQCRNGGELLDHFLDPLSFSYWLVGLAVSVSRLDLGLAAVICLYATAVLTSIKAKLVGEFTLASFGPTEFKALLVAYGIALSSILVCGSPGELPHAVALGFLSTLLLAGLIQLLVNLIVAVRQVNRQGVPPDTSDWETARATNQR